jgi:hypothetical protein
MRLRGVSTIVLCGLLSACGATPTVIPARNLERPGDMGFVCLAIDSDGTLSGQPMRVCHPPDAKDPVFQATATSPRLFGTFAFVTNTARGRDGCGGPRHSAVSSISIRACLASTWCQSGPCPSHWLPVRTAAWSPPQIAIPAISGWLIRRACWLRCSGQAANLRPGPGSPVSTVAPKTKSGRSAQRFSKGDRLLLLRQHRAHAVPGLAIPDRMWPRWPAGDIPVL